MSTVYCSCHILGNVTSHNHLGGVAVVGNINGIIGHRSVVNIDVVDITHVECLALNSERCSIDKRHSIELLGSERPAHITSYNPHCLVAIGNFA